MEVDAVDLMLHELDQEPLNIRVNAMNRLPIVAQTLGDSAPNKGRILGLLTNVLDNEDHEEVLMAMAVALGKLAGYFRLKMIFILERLVRIDETVIRQCTADVYRALAPQLTANEIKQVLVPNIEKVADTKHPPTKVAALLIIMAVFGCCAPAEKKKLTIKINAFFKEDSLLLRRALASKLGELSFHMGKSEVVGLVTSFKKLASDDAHSVRSATVHSLITLSQTLNKDENKKHLLPIIIALSSDKSWRVRFSLAEHFGSLAKAMGSSASDNLLSVLGSLLRDVQPEVRVKATFSLAQTVDLFGLKKLENVNAYMGILVNDSMQLVRTAAGEVLCNLFKLDLKQVFSSNGKSPPKGEGGKLLELITKLIKDPDLEVSMEGIRAFTACTVHFKSAAPLSSILNIVQELLKSSPNWRIRLACLDSILSLAKVIKDQKFFDKVVRTSFTIGLNDQVNKLRNVCRRYIPTFGVYWENKNGLAYILAETSKLAIAKNEPYTHRISAVYCIGSLVTFLLKKFEKNMKNPKSKSKSLLEKSEVVSKAVNKTLFILLSATNVNLRAVTIRVLRDIYNVTKDAALKGKIKMNIQDALEKETDSEAAYQCRLFE